MRVTHEKMSIDNKKFFTNKAIERAFIVGAGFTKAVFKDAPLNDGVLPCLLNRFPDSILQTYYQKYGKENNIEKLLAFIDLELGPEKHSHRTNINSELATFFQKFRFTLKHLRDTPWLRCFGVEVFQDNDIVISLNYDCFLDGLLDGLAIWSPSGYEDVENFFQDNLPINPRGISLYKIHGSESFREASVSGSSASETTIGLEISPDIFPRTCKENGIACFSQFKSEVFLIAPSYVKIFHRSVLSLMNKLLGHAPALKTLVILGCSMR